MNIILNNNLFSKGIERYNFALYISYFFLQIVISKQKSLWSLECKIVPSSAF